MPTSNHHALHTRLMEFVMLSICHASGSSAYGILECVEEKAKDIILQPASTYDARCSYRGHSLPNDLPYNRPRP